MTDLQHPFLGNGVIYMRDKTLLAKTVNDVLFGSFTGNS